MIDIVAHMYFAYKATGTFYDTNYYNLPNGRCTLSDLHELRNWDLVRFINLHFDLKRQQYIPDAGLNSEERTYAERCAIVRTLMRYYHKGIPLQDIIIGERKRVEEQRLQDKKKKQKKKDHNLKKRAAKAKARAKRPLLDERKIVSNYQKNPQKEIK